MRNKPTVEDLEEFCDKLQGPMGDMFHALYRVMGRRMAERGLKWEDFSSQAMLDQFHSAMLEVAPSAFPDADPAEVKNALENVLASVKLETTVNSPSSNAIN